MKEPPEEFSDLCKDLYWFMYGLDRSGLNWDYQETMEALEPVAALETDNAALKERVEELTKMTKGMTWAEFIWNELSAGNITEKEYSTEMDHLAKALEAGGE